MKTTKKHIKSTTKKTCTKKSAIALYWEKMGDKRGEIYDMKAVLK